MNIDKKLFKTIANKESVKKITNEIDQLVLSAGFKSGSKFYAPVANAEKKFLELKAKYVKEAFNIGKKRKEITLLEKGEFSSIMKEKYPKRDGNLEISSAYNKVLGKVKKGELTFDDFFFAVENYKKEMSSVGRVGTSFVKMASTFANGKYKDYLEDETEDSVEGWKAF